MSQTVTVETYNGLGSSGTNFNMTLTKTPKRESAREMSLALHRSAAAGADLVGSSAVGCHSTSNSEKLGLAKYKERQFPQNWSKITIPRYPYVPKSLQSKRDLWVFLLINMIISSIQL